MGGGMFETVSSAGQGFGGRISSGSGDFGPGALEMDIVLVPGLEGDRGKIRLRMTHVEVSGLFAQASIATGKLCGAIPADQIRTTIFPAIADIVSEQVRLNNMYAEQIKTFFDGGDAGDGSCATDSNCVPSAPIGACRCVTTQEIERNALVVSVLQPDLDLDPEKRNPFADPNQPDPTDENDALSMGIRFVGSSASFALP
jgi:hypothetical protein